VVILPLIVYFTNDHNERFTTKLYVLTAMLLLTPARTLHLDNPHDVVAIEVVGYVRRFAMITSFIRL